MRTSKFFTRLAAGAVVVAVAGTGVLVSAANAQTPPGTVAITPEIGTDINAPSGTTSGPCDAVAADGSTSDGYEAFATGPGVFTPNPDAGRPNGVLLQFGTGGSFSKTQAFPFPFRLSFRDLAAELGQTGVLPGDYVITLRCTDSFLGTVFQTYTGGLTFTTATTYEADPVAPSPSPSPSVAPSPSPVVTPSPSPVVTPSPSPVVTPSPSPVVTPSPSPQPGAKDTKTTLSVIQVRLPFGLGGFAIPIANVAPGNAGGTVQFKDGDTNLGGPVRVVGGTAVGPFAFLPRGQHSITAVFTPRNPAAFKSSTSNTVRFRF